MIGEVYMGELMIDEEYSVEPRIGEEYNVVGTRLKASAEALLRLKKFGWTIFV